MFEDQIKNLSITLDNLNVKLLKLIYRIYLNKIFFYLFLGCSGFLWAEYLTLNWYNFISTLTLVIVFFDGIMVKSQVVNISAWIAFTLQLQNDLIQLSNENNGGVPTVTGKEEEK